MNVSFLTPSLSRTAGGIFEIERQLASSLAVRTDLSLKVFGCLDQFTPADRPAWGTVDVSAFPYFGPSNFRWSPSLARAFYSSQADIAHLHVMWMHTSAIIRRWAALTASLF